MNNQKQSNWNIDKEELLRMNNMFFANCLTPYPAQKDHYICPICKGHNLKGFHDSKGKWRFTCWNNHCGSWNGHNGMDAIDLIKECRNCTPSEALDVLKIICKGLETNNPIEIKLEPEGRKRKEPEKENREKYFKECQEKLVSRFNRIKGDGQTRGISLDTFKRYGVGFDFQHQTDWQKRHGGYTPSFIFPVNSTAYTHVDCRTQKQIEEYALEKRPDNPKSLIDSIRKYRKGKAGSPATSFNLMVLDFDNVPDYLFIVEGGFDCLSAIEVGFENTLSIESTGNTGNFIQEIENFRNCNNGQLDTLLIPFMDNDDTGDKAQKELVKVLQEKGFNVAIVDRSLEGCKDLNEYLTTYGAYALENYLQGILDTHLKPKDSTPKEGQLQNKSSAESYIMPDNLEFREAYQPKYREGITKGEQKVQFNMTQDFNQLDDILYQSHSEPERVVKDLIEQALANEGIELFREKHPVFALIYDYANLINKGDLSNKWLEETL